MLRWRFTSDAQPRTKSGQPHQSTAGVANASSAHSMGRRDPACTPGATDQAISTPDIPSTTTGAASATLIQNRRVIETSSGFTSSSIVTVRGSSAMPQIGQEPGPGRTMRGCIGQVYSMRVLGAGGTSGSKAIPHFGHAPGWLWRTSGSIGQTYAAFLGGRRGLGSWFDAAELNQRCGSGRIAVQVFLRLSFEFGGAAGAAEVVRLPGVLLGRLGPFGLDHHSADWVPFHWLGRVAPASFGSRPGASIPLVWMPSHHIPIQGYFSLSTEFR